MLEKVGECYVSGEIVGETNDEEDEGAEKRGPF